ncbi:MAG: Phosphodiesterase of AP superfamily [Candidatus Methanohalarchaeum thermophilum]|uniref:Phosphodiesterase of AP superfamily n=1 Tax=Methanohalarchaeum thermophilum TaxID=1903181 RepID=A0A1Q6DT56_METT1|nr:MAG: Phosphodiesterase of AP superfamily [Candidatus Methanohalarchaeum thermophilum]
MTFFVLGIDAATWKVIDSNLGDLRYFGRLKEVCKSDTMVLEQEPLSPLIWCGMFSGAYPSEHGHREFVGGDGDIVKREDIPVDFIWDELDNDFDVRAINVPFVVPTFSFNDDFEAPGFGLPTDPDEWSSELNEVTERSLELLDKDPDVLISVYTSLDRVQHFHWGSSKVLKWYRRLDEKLGELLFDSGFLEEKDNSLIVVSDHGFCSFGEADVQTLPKETENGELEGDHDKNAILMTKNIEFEIKEPQDIYRSIKNRFMG